MKYTLPDPDDLTLNDAFRIKTATHIDIFNPVTYGHRNAALTWFASQETDEPLKWKDMGGMSINDLSELIETEDDEDEEDEEVSLEDVEIPDPDVADDGPKDLPTSTPPASPGDGGAPHPRSGPAPSVSSTE